jgi:hypothetical protein
LIQRPVLAAVGAGVHFGLHREIMAGVAWAWAR